MKRLLVFLILIDWWGRYIKGKKKWIFNNSFGLKRVTLRKQIDQKLVGGISMAAEFFYFKDGGNHVRCG